MTNNKEACYGDNIQAQSLPSKFSSMWGDQPHSQAAWERG